MSKRRRSPEPYLNLNSPIFDRTVTLRDAYKILEAFVVQYNARGETTTVSLMTDIGIVIREQSCDPAQLHDFARVAGTLLGDDELLAAADAGDSNPRKA